MKFNECSFDEQQVRMSSIVVVQLLAEKLGYPATFEELCDESLEYLDALKENYINEYNEAIK